VSNVPVSSLYLFYRSPNVRVGPQNTSRLTETTRLSAIISPVTDRAFPLQSPPVFEINQFPRRSFIAKGQKRVLYKARCIEKERTIRYPTNGACSQVAYRKSFTYVNRSTYTRDTGSRDACPDWSTMANHRTWRIMPRYPARSSRRDVTVRRGNSIRTCIYKYIYTHARVVFTRSTVIFLDLLSRKEKTRSLYIYIDHFRYSNRYSSPHTFLETNTSLSNSELRDLDEKREGDTRIRRARCEFSFPFRFTCRKSLTLPNLTVTPYVGFTTLLVRPKHTGRPTL